VGRLRHGFNAGASWDGTTAPSPANFAGGVDVGGSRRWSRRLTAWTTGFAGQFLTGTRGASTSVRARWRPRAPTRQRPSPK
jgi:hypothetical protein